LHEGINKVSGAAHIDEKYNALLNQAISKGVEVLVYKASISANEVILNEKIAFIANS